MDDELKTIQCKLIINEDLQTFKNQINRYSYINTTLLNDSIYLLTQDLLLLKYGNSYIRYETAENFLNALSLRFYNVAPIYQKKLEIIAEALDTENEYFIKNIKDFTEDKESTITSSQSDNRKEAETPTGVKASTNFVDKFTNLQTKQESEATSEESGTITHKEINTNDLINRIEQLNNFRSKLLEKYSLEFNDLFIQFL